MRSYPGDVTAVVLAVAGALVLMVVLSRLFSWYRLRALRLCLLTGTRPQRAALWLALAPVVREFLPLLDQPGSRYAQSSWCPRFPLATASRWLPRSSKSAGPARTSSDWLTGWLEQSASPTRLRAFWPRTCCTSIATPRQSSSCGKRHPRQVRKPPFTARR